MLKLLRFRLNNLHIVYVCFRFFFSHRDWLLLLDFFFGLFLCFNFLYCYSIPFDISPYLACAIPAILFTLSSWSFHRHPSRFFMIFLPDSQRFLPPACSVIIDINPFILFLSFFFCACFSFSFQFQYISHRKRIHLFLPTSFVLHQFSSFDFVTRYD